MARTAKTSSETKTALVYHTNATHLRCRFLACYDGRVVAQARSTEQAIRIATRKGYLVTVRPCGTACSGCRANEER